MNEIIMELNNRGYKAESTTVIKNGVENDRVGDAILCYWIVDGESLRK